MLKIKGEKVKVQSSEINIRHRYFEECNIITIGLRTSFYPILINDRIVHGTIEVSVDTDNVNSLRELNGKEFKEGKLSVTLNEDGIWNTYKYNEFKLSFGEYEDNCVKVELELDEIELKKKSYVESIYTFNEENLNKHFDMSDFYDKKIIKQMSNKEIIKYYTK